MVASEPFTENTPTKTLVEVYQSGSSASKVDRNQAFVILTYRFRREVLKKCEIICKRHKYDTSTAEMIAIRTFDSYARKGQFNEAKGKGDTYDESFLLYLLRIAERELINYYREIERAKKNPYNGTEQIYHELPDIKLVYNPIELAIELDVIKNLPSSHRTIFLTYKVHQRQGFKMPRKLLADLRNELGGISQNTVNCYLKEARDEIKRALDTYRLTEKLKENGK